MTFCNLNESPELHLQILKEVTAALSESSDLEATLTAILRLLKKHAGMKRGALSLIDPATGAFSTEISEGLGTKNHPGEKIIALVLKSGRPVAIPSVGDEPLYVGQHLPKNALKKEKVAFLCVPVRYKGKVVGALSVDLLSKAGPFT
ncbi:MAG: GAF domain-containing protein, partial [Deltaproteobacteria bacterium]|nr:GAF domain-containing protein [Deltaproteobacteria bacterium]